MADNNLIFNIGVNTENFTKGLDKVKDGFKGVTEKAEDFGDKAARVSDKLLGKFTNTPFFKKIDESLGGLGKGFIDLGAAGIKAAKSIQIGSKLIKAALISTGIGAFIVAVGLIAANWDNIKEAVTGVNKELRTTIERLEEQVEAQQRIVTNLNNSDNILKLQGKTQLQINNLKIKELEILIEQKRALLQNNLIALKGAQETQQAWTKGITGLIKVFNAPIEFFIRGMGFAIDQVIANLNKIPGVDIDFIGKGFAEKTIGGINRIQDKLTKVIAPDLTSDLTESIKETEDEILKLQNTVAGLKLNNLELGSRSGIKPLFSQEFLGNLKTGLAGLEAIPPTVAKVEGNLATIPDSVGDKMRNLIYTSQQLFTEFSELAAESLGGALAGIGESIGAALVNGTSVIQAVGAGLLQALGGLASKLGDLFIQYAITSGIFGKALAGIASGNPATIAASAGILLAAGIALKAIGGAIGAAAKGGGGGAGGGGGGAGDFSGGGNVSTSSQFAGGSGGGKVVFEIAGTKLIGVLNNTSRANTRAGGGAIID